MRLFLINDTAIEFSGVKASNVSLGGTSAFLSGFINYIFVQKIEFYFIGNFKSDNISKTFGYIPSRSNFFFLIGLLKTFTTKRFFSHDILYFQRPDHLAFSLFSPARKVLHLHGPIRNSIISRRGFFSKGVYCLLERIAMSKASLVISSDDKTSSLYTLIYPHLSKKTHTIPSGLDFTFFQDTKAKFSTDRSKPGKKLVYIGRLAHPKLICDMIYGFALAANKQSDLVFHIAGDGPLLPTCKQIVIDCGLAGKVIFNGKLSKKGIFKLIHSCDAGILLSSSEGSPISVKEILACGKPVIVNNVGDVCDYILEGKTGYIVDPFNHVQVAETIVRALDNAKKMSESCVGIARKYDETIINEKILNLITH